MKILSSTKPIYSHPDTLLKNHLRNVAEDCKYLFQYYGLNSNVGYLMGYCHDFAKSTTYFQEYLITHCKHENTRHGFMSSIFTYYIIKEYTKDVKTSLMACVCVLHHHINLKNIYDLSEYYQDQLKYKKYIINQLNDLQENMPYIQEVYSDDSFIYNKIPSFISCFNEITCDLIEELVDFSLTTTINDYYTLLHMYSILLDADKKNAAHLTVTKKNNTIPSEQVDKYKKDFNTGGINRIREQAYQEVNMKIKNTPLTKHIYTINLPTGIGKTLTGVKTSLTLKNRLHDEKNINSKIIYCLPYLSIIDQNSEIIQEILENPSNEYFLKHNYLSSMEYDDYDTNKSRLLIEGWDSEFIITTFNQLFESIIGNRNNKIRKFHNIINSIIILDEIQAIPCKYYTLINNILTYLTEKYNCYIILMTATQPVLFQNNEIVPLITDKEYYFNQFNRVEYNFNLQPLKIDEFLEKLKKKIKENPEKDIMVVVNTIESARKIYDKLKNNTNKLDNIGVCNLTEDTDLIFLSTQVIPKHRLHRINHIKKTSKRKIVISTQLIEAGVDISMDIIYRDLAPLDSIIQTAGRCNRNNNTLKGEVNIISLITDYGKPYSGFVYDSTLLNCTREIISEYNIVNESEFNNAATEKYFSLLNSRKKDDEKIIDEMNYLNYQQIEYDFQLIEDNPETVSCFINITPESNHIIQNYLQEDYHYLLEHKEEFYEYVVTTRRTKKDNEEELLIIDQQEYLLDTGLHIT